MNHWYSLPRLSFKLAFLIMPFLFISFGYAQIEHKVKNHYSNREIKISTKIQKDIISPYLLESSTEDNTFFKDDSLTIVPFFSEDFTETASDYLVTAPANQADVRLMFYNLISLSINKY